MSAKRTERLLTLVILLLSTKRGYTKEELFREIELYSSAASPAAREKLFDRDKAMLREQGIPVESFSEDKLFENDNSDQRYRIKAEDYRLPGVTFTPEESTALALAAGMWDQAALGSAATRAVRKLQARGFPPDADTRLPIEPRIRTSEPHWEEVWRATTSGTEISFGYRAASTGREEQRKIQPWGMGTRYGHWYVVGFDLHRGAERFFRLSRITTTPVTSSGRYKVPAGFSMKDSLAALDRVGEPHQARVRLRSGTGQLLRTRRDAVILGSERDWDVVSFHYGDIQEAASRISALGGNATVEEPAQLATLVESRLALAVQALSDPVPTVDFTGAFPQTRTNGSSAEAHLRRLLDLVPYLLSHPGAELEQTAARFGVSRAQLTSDLDLLFVSGPRYYPDGLIDVRLEDDRIYLSNASNLAEPVRLNMDEACALIVGLDALKGLPGLGSDSGVESAFAKLTEAAGEAGRAGTAIATRLTEDEVSPTLELLRDVLNARVQVLLRYLVPSRDEITERKVEPVRVFSRDDVWYLEAWCTSAESLRNFRLDRIQNVAVTEIPVVGSHDPGGIPEQLFMPSDTDEIVGLILRPSARWVAEHYNAERTVELEDGQLAVEIRVASTSWIPGLLASLGGDASVSTPAGLREAASAWLFSALRNYR